VLRDRAQRSSKFSSYAVNTTLTCTFVTNIVFLGQTKRRGSNKKTRFTFKNWFVIVQSAPIIINVYFHACRFSSRSQKRAYCSSKRRVEMAIPSVVACYLLLKEENKQKKGKEKERISNTLRTPLAF